VNVFGTRRSAGTDLPVEGRLPGFSGATGWLNSEPLPDRDLRGNVVLVDFWTYTCINWLRTLGYVRAWAERYSDHGLVVVGVHTPEFPFERDVENVRRAVSDLAVEFPVAMDSGYAVWDAFGNRYWPAAYIADADGQIRHHQFGEGGYEECERVIQRLLRESGRDGVDDGLVSVSDTGIEAQADWSSLGSPETYLGAEQARTFVHGGDELRLNQWTVVGDWTVAHGTSVLDRGGGGIRLRFHARDVHLVLRTQGGPVPFRVLLDGEPPGSAHGLDVDDEGRGTLVEPRLYQLIRQPGSILDRTAEITFHGAGVEAYAFTFG
jgi:thiol-disulfide isomerase/thioredoxin